MAKQSRRQNRATQLDRATRATQPDQPGGGAVDRRMFVRMLGAAGIAVGAAAAAGPLNPLGATPAQADVPGAPAAPHQPFMHGYDAAALKSWSPETDRFATYFRSRVPRADRIAPFAATQANPELAYGAQVLQLSADYDNSFFTAYKYNDTYARRLLRFWQYTDIYASWHGMPIDGSPTDKPVHGLINLPNPAWTDAAHRNGAKSLACWFWPRPGTFADYLEKRADGSFVVADKMIEMADWFGYDGYFINQEATISAADAHTLMDMLVYLRRTAPAGFHVQWYDTIMVDGELDYQNQFNDKNSPWIKHEDGTPVNTSIFPNYAWNAARVATSKATAEQLGLDPYDVAYLGTENEKYGYNPPYDPRHIFPEGGKAQTSWGLFGSHFVWSGASDPGNPDAQDEVYVRERRFWSGPNQDPSHTGRTDYHEYPDKGVPNEPNKYQAWDGVAHYITERSAIGAFPFVTRFNTGHGRAFWLKGRKAGAAQWNNASIGDVLPTWQWWVRASGSAAPLDVDFDDTAAWDGGSSLRISGTAGAAGESTAVRLYKTRLAVRGGEQAALTVSGGEGCRLELGLVFEDAPDAEEWVPFRTGPGWTRSVASMKPYAGRTIAALALRVTAGSAGDVDLRIGELALTDGGPGAAPAAPTGFRVDAVHPAADGKAAEVFLSWDLAPASDVRYYEITRGGEHVGRIYDDVYYVKSLTRKGNEATALLTLTPVAHDGTEGAPANTAVRW